MKRREIPGGIRYITFSCQRRLPLLKNSSIAQVMQDAIAASRRKFGFELFAWVIMPEHAHMMMRSSQFSLDRPLLFIKLAVSNRVLARWREMQSPILDRIATREGQPRFWQKGGGFDRNVRDDAEFMREIRYIHRNPVERGLVETPEDWRWSSVRWWMGSRDGELPCDPPPGDPRKWNGWRGFK